MAACFSSSGILSLPPVYVLSKIARLAESLKSIAIPRIQVKQINLPDSFGEDSTVTKEYTEILKNVEITICDADLLVKTFAFMPELKWAHNTWAGVELILKAIPQEPLFTVTRHSGEAFTSLIAEYVVCHILNFERLSKLCWKNQESKIWMEPENFYNSRSLNELTVGILGAGNMACAIAKFLKSRGTTVFGFARIHRPPGTFFDFDEIFTNLDDILPKCDYLCNTLPSTPLTSGLLSNSILKKCEKKPVFINVGRGNIIAENELIQALRNKWLSGAVLDVFEEEPLPKSSELWDMEQVIITPHIAAFSKPEHIAEEFFNNLINYVDGHGLQNVINWKAGY